VPDSAEILRALSAQERSLVLSMRRKLQTLRQTLQQGQRSLQRLSPRARLQQHAQRLDELEQRLQRGIRHRLERTRLRLDGAAALLGRSSPTRRLAPLQQRLQVAGRRLPVAMQRRLLEARERLERSARTLHAVSPLATLDRGYAIVTDENSRVITDPTGLAPGARITARVARGIVLATVTTITPGAATNVVPPRGRTRR
jgi:exodeoxyribonuclease VII large subunit